MNYIIYGTYINFVQIKVSYILTVTSNLSYLFHVQEYEFTITYILALRTIQLIKILVRKFKVTKDYQVMITVFNQWRKKS